MKILILSLFIIYILACSLLYFIQEKLLFFPYQLPENYTYQYSIPHQEITIPTKDGKTLSSVLFEADSSKGVVLFLHGNGGTIQDWGHGADIYIRNQYDVLYLDYRSYGKSQGKIISEQQLISDAQLAYDYLEKKYGEENIILSGTSMGTGVATQLAANNQPKHLILVAPYSSLKSLIMEKIKIIPPFIIKYQLESKNYIHQVECPVSIFHGRQDELIPVHHARILKEKHAPIQLHIIENTGHNTINDHKEYYRGLTDILNG